MARLMDGEIEKLKQDVSLPDMVRAYGVELKKKGKELIGLCPFHDDHSPSLVISPDKNLWHCMGACQEGGSVIDWVMKSESVSFRNALEILKERENPGVLSREIRHVKVKKPPIRQLDSPFNFDTDTDMYNPVENQVLLNQVIDFYNETLKQSPGGLEYLEKRGLKNLEMIDHFKLGLSNRTLCYRLPAINSQAGKKIREKLQEVGIYREKNHEHFAGSLVIPIYNETGGVVEIYGRKLRKDLRKGTVLHLYLPGPHQGVWNFSALAAAKCKEIILCEALIDALTFWCYGFRNVTSSYGINGFTKDHLQAFKRCGTERVLIAYDADEAGDKAAEALAPRLQAEGIDCFRIQFPDGMDANSFAQKFTNVEKAFNRLIQNAIRKEIGKMTKQGQVEQGEHGEQEIVKNNAAKEEKKESKAPDHDHENEDEKPLTTFAPSSFDNIQVERKPEEIRFIVDNRFWRFRGLLKNMSYDTLKVSVMVKKGDKYHLDTLDLCQARQRGHFIKQAAVELEDNDEILKIQLGKMLLKLEEFQDEQIKQALEPKKKEIIMTEKERKEAMDLLKAPDLLERILRDFERCGVVGEQTNKLVSYLAAVSRKLDNPLAILIQSSSAAGKTWLMESVLAFVPEEERIKYSSMTGQSLFYMGETNIKNKILAIVEEEGAERTQYALKLLQSEGELSIASTGKDAVSGQLTTKEYRVEGPVMIFSTTTNIDIDEELQNRCIILTVDESREQTRAIHQKQREQRTLKGLKHSQEKTDLLKVHHNAQRLLRPLPVINPYAHRLTFLDDKTRMRRDHEKYLTLIDAITLLHQYQRPLKTFKNGDKGNDNPTLYVSVTLDDIEIANRLASKVLGRSLDELPPQTRRFLEMVKEMVKKECERLNVERADYRLSRRQICEYTGWSLTQVRLHLDRLVEHEYVLVHRGSRGLSFVYELLYNGEGKQGEPFLMGLIDINQLINTKKDSQTNNHDEKVAGLGAKNDKCDHKVAGLNGELAGSKRPQNAPKTGGWRDGLKPLVNKVLPLFLEKSEKKGI